jgi:general L-amino acid transport system substrate-binding protein
MPDRTGQWTGIYADLCRAVAAAILGDAKRVEFIPTTTVTRFALLQSGDIDVLSRTATATLSREVQLGLRFAPIWFYDGQAVLVAKKTNVSSVKQLEGASICLQQGSTSELNISEYFRTYGLKYSPLTVATLDAVEDAFLAGRCDAYSNDATPLIGLRLKVANPEDYVILPERLSKEPTSIAVRRGDDQLHDIVRWTVYALIEAEELGVSSGSVERLAQDGSPAVKRLLGTEPGTGKALGLDDRWVAAMVKSVGNYGEIFDRNLGKGSRAGLDRGLNDLWTRGGQMYAWPLR